jgi:hypothetical protein
MYVARVPNRGSSPAILVRESYRQDGKVRTRTLANISKLPGETIEVIERSLRGQRLLAPEDLFEVTEDGSPAHGHVQAVLVAMRRLRFESLIASRRSRERDLVVAMVAARIVIPKPKSKIGTTRWWGDTTLPELLDVADSNEDDLYAAMDWLLQRQSTIEKKLAGRHLEDKGLALYDLSSSYFEGITCPLAALGHNRDGKKGKLQVNYGLLCNRAGVPVSVSVFEGNTGDTTTLLPQVSKLRDDFGIEHVVLVGDRGMITQKQIDALRDIDDVDWITALRAEGVRKLVEGGQIQMDLFDERQLFEVASHPDFPHERLVACRNVALGRLRAIKRQSLLDATSDALRKVQAMVERGRLRGKEAITHQLEKAAVSAKLRRHVRFTVRDDGFDLVVDEDRLVAEATRTTMADLEHVRLLIQSGRLRGRDAIRARLTKELAKRNVGQHIATDIRGDGFDISIDEKAIVANAMAPLLRRLDDVRRRIDHGQLHGAAAIGVRTGKVINTYKVGKHFVLDIRDDGFDFSIDHKKVAAEAALDGIYIVRTSLPKTRMDTDETVRSYKALTNVERAFRTLKSIDIQVRPIRHRLEDRVRAHIFLCMLAYYVEWHMREAWRPLLFADEDQQAKASRDPVAPAKRSDAALRKASIKRLDDGSQVHSFETLMDHLAAIVRNTCRRLAGDEHEPTFHMITPPNPKQQQAYDLLEAISL